MSFRLTLITATLFASACSTQTQLPANLTQCSEPRPEVCTMIYDPVCGYHADGSFKTYASDCSACAEKTVVGYVTKACAK